MLSLRHTKHTASQCSITHMEDIAIFPLLHNWSQRCPGLTSVSVIGNKKWPISFIQFSLYIYQTWYCDTFCSVYHVTQGSFSLSLLFTCHGTNHRNKPCLYKVYVILSGSPLTQLNQRLMPSQWCQQWSRPRALFPLVPNSLGLFSITPFIIETQGDAGSMQSIVTNIADHMENLLPQGKPQQLTTTADSV